MFYDFTNLSIIAKEEIELFAAELFSKEIESRTGVLPNIIQIKNDTPTIELSVQKDISDSKDIYVITQLENNYIKISSIGIRGLIYGYSLFLRKTIYNDGKITLIENISGKYVPDMKIRGHQLGYRTTPNTYDAWTTDDYFRYFLDLMYFGVNTCELIPPNSVDEIGEPRNRLMKKGFMDMLTETIDIANKLDLDISLWYPNDDNNLDKTLEIREEMFKRLKKVDYLFIPGGDPGEYPAKEFLNRVLAISKVFKKYFPNSEVWPSAQAPHNQPNWGDEFIGELEKLPDEIDGVIMGPNHAFPIEELRRKVPEKYPLRLYNDITHNVRCEYPVHYPLDDWHYSVASVNGRESVNPRPIEFHNLHRKTARYIIGSVSYSEGVTDDLNKALWSSLDFDFNSDVREILCDYSRLFFPGISETDVADAILGLEYNWIGDAAENPHIESTLKMWKTLLDSNKDLMKNWRFVMYLFRAECDALVRRRRIFENALVKDAIFNLKDHKLNDALNILKTDFNNDYTNLRNEIFKLGDMLFNMIGLQLDVEHYLANNFERGAVLDTLDQSISNRSWLLNCVNKALKISDASEQKDYIQKVLSRNIVDTDEFYFSVAEHGLDVLNTTQRSEIYQNFIGDRVNRNNGTLPTCVLKIFDSWTFDADIGGLKNDTDYLLRVTYSKNDKRNVEHHKIIVNNTLIYDGPGYGGTSDPDFDSVLIPEDFVTATYLIPCSLFENGCITIKIEEPTVGFELCEFWLLKAKN